MATFDGTSGPDTIDGTEDPDVIRGFGGDDTLRGHGGDDEIDGGDGNDTLDGGSGADRMTGGAGNDHYIVSLQGTVTVSEQPSGSSLLYPGAYLNSSQPDVITELSGGGTDTIWVPFTGSTTAHNWFDYTLIRGDTLNASNHVERLGVYDQATTYAVNLQGDHLNNEIWGNDGPNVLDGWTGADIMGSTS